VAKIYLEIVLLPDKLVWPGRRPWIGRLLLLIAVESGSSKNNKYGTKRSLNMVNWRLVAVVERNESGEKVR